MERRSVSEQPHDLEYKANKTGTTPKKDKAAKKSAVSNQRSAIENNQIAKLVYKRRSPEMGVIGYKRIGGADLGIYG